MSAKRGPVFTFNLPAELSPLPFVSSFTPLVPHPCFNQSCGAGVGRSQRFLAGVGVGFLTTLGVGVGFFVRLRMSNWIIFYITLLNWEFLLKW